MSKSSSTATPIQVLNGYNLCFGLLSLIDCSLKLNKDTMGSFLFILLLSLLPWSHSFYGAVPPVLKNKGDTLEVMVNKLSSIRFSAQIPYDYYFLSYCKPPVIINSSLSLGQVLRGDRIQNSVYSFKMREDEYCKVACRVKLDANAAKDFKEKIDGQYQVNMILDDLPAAVEPSPMIHRQGFMVGMKGQYYSFETGMKVHYAGDQEERHFINNHLSFKVMYHEDLDTDYAHIVGFVVTPYRTQLPYDYYSLSYCKPPVIVNRSLSLGQVLRGDLIKNSVYNFKMRDAEYCKIVCRVKLNEASAKKFKEKIDDEYRVNMILDNLPVAVVHSMIEVLDGRGESNIYVPGIQVGIKGNYAGSNEYRYFIYNHLSFKVKYHEDPETDYAHIVGFEVKPYSIVHEYKEWEGEKTKLLTCTPSTKTLIIEGNGPQEVVTNTEVVFTYDVSFQPSDVKWESRWDTYRYMSDDPIHWFSIINSLIFVLFLSGVEAMMVMRTLYKDITSYNKLETKDESREVETGWKLVHGDVFRAPHNANILCACVGNGVQVFGMTLVTMIFALLAFFSPTIQVELNISMVLLLICTDIFAGYSSARLYKMFKGTEWKKMALLTALMFPAICFGIIFMLNALVWREKSCGAVPYGTMFSLGLMWFGISVPLVFLGSYFGFKRPAIEDPVEANEIPREIPKQAWYKWVLSVLGGGFLPFAVVFTEFFFILISIWLDQFYFFFGFLSIVFVILLVTCCEIAILLCYFQLRSEDYNWWWRAYLTAGSSALQMFAYSIYYFFAYLEIEKFTSVILYFGSMLIASFAFFLLTGTVGFFACFWFVRKIYTSVKFD